MKQGIEIPDLRPRSWDMLVVLGVLLLMAGTAFAVWRVPESDGLTAVITTDRDTEERVALSPLSEPKERVIESNGYTLHLTMDANGVEMTGSDCPTQECVYTGRITRVGQSIVCLPARVAVRLEGSDAAGANNSGGVDAVAG